jgi:phytoene/squalene synthetase
MTNIQLFKKLSEQCSRNTTQLYSTSFASAINLLHADLRQPIHNIYGFVRLADEIVDTFHAFNKADLLHELKSATKEAIDRKISINPVLNSFQQTVHEYQVDAALIDAFLYSMELDLEKRVYDDRLYNDYIYGSAEVVGLMCLKVFTGNDAALYHQLMPYAKSLGAAFQKVNFLRDIKSDTQQLGRMYFPGCNFDKFSESDKAAIESDIEQDFHHAYQGIICLPLKAKLAVYVAYQYYFALFKKIKRMQPAAIIERRIRIPNHNKLLILANAGLRNHFNLL